MERLKCPNCGNDKSFYRIVSIQAKLKVNNKGEDLKIIYDINKNIIDNYFEPICCSQCNTIIDVD